MNKTEAQNVMVVMPSTAWASLKRRTPSAARGNVVDVTADIVELLDVVEEVSRCASINALPGLEVTCTVIGRERSRRLVRAIRRFRGPFELLGGRRVYQRKIV